MCLNIDSSHSSWSKVVECYYFDVFGNKVVFAVVCLWGSDSRSWGWDFVEITDQLVYNEPITLQASATSGLPVTFEVVQGPATLDGNILTLTGEEGLVKVRASQPGDGTSWQSAPAVTRTFYVVDPENYAPEITIRRPYEGTKVYMPDFDNPVMVVLSAYIDHGTVLKFEEVKCEEQPRQWLLVHHLDTFRRRFL